MPDSAGFVQDTEPFRRELLAHCYRMLGSIHDAEDLVQETYLRAWRSYGGFEGRSSVRTWLYQIATNACLTALASAVPAGAAVRPCTTPSRIPAHPEEAGPEVPGCSRFPTRWWPRTPADPAAIVAARAGPAAGAHRQPAVPAAAGSGRCWSCGMCWRFPAAEVAVMLGTTTASVKSALQRARARLEELAPTADQITEPAAPQARALLDQYIAAFENADVAALERLLLRDATLEATPSADLVRRPQDLRAIPAQPRPGSPGDWRMLATSANGQPAAAAYTRDQHGGYRPYGICVLTVTGAGIRRISSFGDPRLVTVFGFRPDTAQAEDAEPAPPGCLKPGGRGRGSADTSKPRRWGHECAMRGSFLTGKAL